MTYIICLYVYMCLYVSQDLFGLEAAGDDLPARGKVLPIGKGRIVKEHTVGLHIPYTTIIHISFYIYYSKHISYASYIYTLTLLPLCIILLPPTYVHHANHHIYLLYTLYISTPTEGS